jgi:glycogen synthase
MLDNNKGFIGALPLIVKILVISVVAILIVPGAMFIFPWVKYVIMGLIIFFIYENAAQAFGEKHILTFIVTGILAYFLVYKYLYLTSAIMMAYLFLGFGLVSVFFWGTSTISRKAAAKKGR